MANQVRDTRPSREQETRAADPGRDWSEFAMDWESPLLLDTKNIPARPGFVQRWVRTKDKGGDDQTNVFKKINQGWRPRALDSVPKGCYIPSIDFNGSQVIGIHGMILMERPEDIHQKHAEHNRRQAKLLSDSVKANIANMQARHDPNSGVTAPVMYSDTKVTRGRIPDIDD